MSLLDAAERFAALDRSAVTLDAKRCLHALDRFSGCEACYGICPVDAITPGKPPGLDAEKCQTCLACLTVCPVGAYSADDAVTSLLNSVARVEMGKVELVCAKNGQAAKGVQATSTGIQLRGCLAGLGTGTYLALAALGLERVILRTEACPACEWANLCPEIESQLNRARHFLSAWNESEAFTCVTTLENTVERPLWNADNPPLSRRDMFRMITRQGQVALARAMENGRAHPDRRPGRDHLRVSVAVDYLRVTYTGVGPDLDELNFASVLVTEAGTACGICARGCPTGALNFEKSEDETTYALKFSARQCVGCDLCVHVCVESAITVDHKPTFPQVFGEEITVLGEGELVKCQHCGVLMAKRGDAHLCTLCGYRQTHPFGSMLPLGFKRVAPVSKEAKK
jgi:ferredoxin